MAKKTTKTVKATLVLEDSAGVVTKNELKLGKSKGGKPTVAPANETATLQAYGKLYLKF